MDRTALPPGTRLAELEIVRVLAAGGFGIVYLARDHALDREVAVKEFMPTLLAQRGHGQRVTVRRASAAQTYTLGLQSFIDEARLLARLSHPAVVKVYRFWKANGTGYMTMPYLCGPTLGDVRRSMSGPPTEAWLRRIIDPLLDALAALHAEGFYHRDIAPDNVLVAGNGLPILLDFGAARRVIASRTGLVTAIVKPHFAPIEQYADARLLPQGPWTDLYALGALVAYLLDGVPPPASTARTLHDEMPTLALRRVPDVSATFLAAIDWALAVRPQDRPQSVAEMRAALAGRRASPTMRRTVPAVPARASARSVTDGTGTGKRHRHLPARASFAAASAAALAALVVAFAWTPIGGPAELPFAAALPVATFTAPTSVTPRVDAATIERRWGDVRAVSDDRATRVAVPPRSVVTTRVAAAQPDSGRAPATKSPGPGSAKSTRRAERRQASSAGHAASVRKPGPAELCSDRNFFLRPWCTQRRCAEPRFKGHAQCAPREADLRVAY